MMTMDDVGNSSRYSFCTRRCRLMPFFFSGKRHRQEWQVAGARPNVNRVGRLSGGCGMATFVFISLIVY